MTNAEYVELDRIASWAARRSGRPELVDDLRAEAWLGIVKALQKVTPADGSYLATAAKRHAVKALRRLAWAVALPESRWRDAPEGHRVPFPKHIPARTTTCEPDTYEWVRAALNALPQPCRDTMFAFYIDGYSIHDLEQRFGIGREGIRKRLRKGRDLLRPELSETFNGDHAHA